MEGRGGHHSPSSPHGGQRRHEAAGGERLCVEGGAAGGSHFMVDKRARASTAGHLALTRRTARPRLARVGSPAADWWATQSVKGGEGKGSTWRGTDFSGPRSAPYLGRCGLGTARGALTPRRCGARTGACDARRRGAALAGPTFC
jgi:hypothetical protein